jgi:predicted metal-binding membrane protein
MGSITGGTTRSGRADGRPIAAVVLVLAATAWAVLLAWSGHDLGHGPAHGGHGPVTAAPNARPIALGGWVIMVAAMMLPPALPLARVAHRVAGARRGGTGLALLALSGFLSVWAGVGVVLIAVQVLIDTTARPVTGWPAGLVGGALMVAGAFQFTRLKTACLRACRTPRWFALRYWHGRAPAREAAVLGTAYGVSCVGCCWALMVLCFVAGTTALPVMVGLSVLMAVERLTRWGRRVVRPAGAALIGMGAAVLLGVVPAPVPVGLVGA